MSNIFSPLTGSTNIIKEKVLDVVKIKDQYLKEFNIDVSAYFTGIRELCIYECLDSKLRFYHPFTVIGDHTFYATLSKNYQAYYHPWKWEHEKVFNIIGQKEKVLELGCGRASFLQKLKEQKSAIAVGLELNEDAIEYGKAIGIEISNDTIHEHANKHEEEYDTICAFQLLEHVNDIRYFLKDSIKCLKKGGKLAIGVPNNKSYLYRRDTYHTLNLPPHHMLLWDENSLNYLAKLFDLEIVEIVNQPMSSMHLSAIYKVWLKNIFGDHLLSKLIHQCTRFMIKRLPILRSQGITTVAIFRKI